MDARFSRNSLHRLPIYFVNGQLNNTQSCPQSSASVELSHFAFLRHTKRRFCCIKTIQCILSLWISQLLITHIVGWFRKEKHKMCWHPASTVLRHQDGNEWGQKFMIKIQKSLPFRLAAGEKAITGRKFGKLALSGVAVASS